MRRAALPFLGLAIALTTSRLARADEAPPRASWHPSYLVDSEIHGVFGVGDAYGPGGGLGARFTLPVWDHAPFSRLDDTIGLSIGVDWVRYGSYAPPGNGGDPITSDAFYIPLSLPVDIWLGRVALFVEPAVVWRFTRYDGCVHEVCEPSTRFFPTGFVGARIKTIDHVAITIRAGWPLFSLGASWL